MKTIIKKISIIAVVFAVVFSLDNTKVSAAGGLNAAEQRAIAAAKQPFEYNGKTYVVNNAYISQATAKMSADGVDMSDAEATQYIAQFNGSHQELIEEGYCNEVSSGGKSNKSDKKDSDDKKSDKKKDKKKKSDDKDKEEQHSSKTSSLNRVFLRELFGKGKKEVETTPAPVSEQQSSDGSQKTENVWADEEENLNTVSTITTDDVDYTYANKVNISYKDKQYDSEYNFLKDILHINIVKIIWFVVLGAAVIALGLQIAYIYNIKKKGQKNRKYRRAIAVYSGVVIGCMAVLLIMSLVLKCGFLSKSVVDRELMESDYFSGAVQTVKEMGKKDLKSAGYDESIADDVFKLSNIYITQKQYIKNLLKDGSKKAEISNEKISDLLKEKITKKSKKKNKKLIKELEEDYKSAFSFKYGDAVYKCNKEFSMIFVGIVVSMVIIFIAMFYLLLQMYEYKHKAVRVYAFAVTIASIPVIIAGAVLRIIDIASKVTVSPVYYQDFITKYLVWNINICIYMGLISLLIGIILFFVKNYLHRLHVE